MIDNLVMAPLEVILPNPFQPRQGEDAEHVKNLAVSIAEKGLKQIPVGRMVDKDGIRIAWEEMLRWKSLLKTDWQDVLKESGWQMQLACGHSRLAAYRLLKETGNKGFDCMPVMLDDLDDAGMFETALIENVQRRNLTPVEEATAMKRLRDEFEMTSPEIGKLFGLGDSAVRNKIRLLNLPEELRQKLSEHLLSESAARALLELYDLPEDLRQEADKIPYYDNNPKNIIKAALEGENAENILSQISYLIQRFSNELSKATWKWDEVFTGDPRLVGPCKGCQYLVKNDKRSLCIKTGCYTAKEMITKQRYLEEASQISGIKVRGGNFDSSLTNFHYQNNTSAFELAKSIKCPNLCLIYDEYEHRPDADDHLKSIGFPRAQIVCGKQQQWCSCIQAVKAGLQDILAEKVAPTEKVAEPEYIPVGDSADPGVEVIHINPSIPVTLDQLKEVSKAARQKKKENLEESRGMAQEAAKIMAAGLMNITNPRIWLVLLDTMDWSGAKDIERESKGDYSDNPIAWCDEIRFLIGTALINKVSNENYYYSDPDPDLTLKRLNDYLKKAGLQELEVDVSAETVEVKNENKR
jgi:ParB/RepB/Spo0J family partition protein